MNPRRLQRETSFSRTVASAMFGAPKTKRHPAFRERCEGCFGPRRHVRNLDAECRDQCCGIFDRRMSWPRSGGRGLRTGALGLEGVEPLGQPAAATGCGVLVNRPLGGNLVQPTG